MLVRLKGFARYSHQATAFEQSRFPFEQTFEATCLLCYRPHCLLMRCNQRLVCFSLVLCLLTDTKHNERSKYSRYDKHCSACLQVWFALEEKNISYDTVLINLQDKPEWYKTMIPTQLVPAAKINGKLVYESYDIMMVWFNLQCLITHLEVHA